MEELVNPQGQTQNIRTYIQVNKSLNLLMITIHYLNSGNELQIFYSINNLKFQAVGAICRQAGHRFGDHVEKVVPLVLQYAKMEDEELREQCLQVC